MGIRHGDGSHVYQRLRQGTRTVLMSAEDKGN